MDRGIRDDAGKVTRYLLSDHTGPASRIEYGKAGDQVEVEKIVDNMALVVPVKGGEKFHIRVEKLSETKPDIQVEVVKTEPVKTENTKVKKGKPVKKQTELF